MGKTLTSVLEVAAVVAVQAIPGIGQAVGVAFSVSAAAGAAIAAGAVIATETLLNATLLAPHAAKPGLPEMAFKGPLPDRRSGYGTARERGYYTL